MIHASHYIMSYQSMNAGPTYCCTTLTKHVRYIPSFSVRELKYTVKRKKKSMISRKPFPETEHLQLFTYQNTFSTIKQNLTISTLYMALQTLTLETMSVRIFLHHASNTILSLKITPHVQWMKMCPYLQRIILCPYEVIIQMSCQQRPKLYCLPPHTRCYRRWLE